jgi:hypothetical protein
MFLMISLKTFFYFRNVFCDSNYPVNFTKYGYQPE